MNVFARDECPKKERGRASASHKDCSEFDRARVSHDTIETGDRARIKKIIWWLLEIVLFFHNSQW